MRVLLDANILVSYLLPPRTDSPVTQIVTHGLLGDFVLILPEGLLTELKVKSREKKYLAERIAPEEVSQLVDTLASLSELIPAITEAIPAVTRVPKDDYLLAHALVGRADYLVTGDADLLALGRIGKLSIVTAQAFLRAFKAQ